MVKKLHIYFYRQYPLHGRSPYQEQCFQVWDSSWRKKCLQTNSISIHSWDMGQSSNWSLSLEACVKWRAPKHAQWIHSAGIFNSRWHNFRISLWARYNTDYSPKWCSVLGSYTQWTFRGENRVFQTVAGLFTFVSRFKKIGCCSAWKWEMWQ